MNFTDMDKKFLSELKSKESGAYLLVSEESFLLESAIKEITAIWLGDSYDPLQVITLDSSQLSSEAFLSSVLTFGMFVQKRLALLRDMDSLSTEVSTAIAEAVTAIPPGTLLVCTIRSKRAPRSKLVKSLSEAGGLVELPALRGGDLYRWLRQTAKEVGLTLAPEAEAELAATFGSDLYQLRNELDKLATYIGKDGVLVGLSDLKAVMGRSSLHNIFNLTDALGSRNLLKAKEELNQLLRSGESPIYVLTMLGWHLANLWQCKTAPSANPQNLAKLLGIHPYVATKSLKQAENFSVNQLEEAYLLTVEAEYLLKTGKAPRMDVELDRLIVKSITNS